MTGQPATNIGFSLFFLVEDFEVEGGPENHDVDDIVNWFDADTDLIQKEHRRMK